MTAESYFNLQKTLQRTDTNLETFSTTLKDVERCLSTTQLQVDESASSSSVLEVLESMSTVRNEYNTLRQDLQEVQQLQKEMATTLQYQMRSMTQTYNILKKRIESTASLPAMLPPDPPLNALRKIRAGQTESTTSLSSSPPSQ